MAEPARSPVPISPDPVSPDPVPADLASPAPASPDPVSADPDSSAPTLTALAELVAVVDRLRDPVGGCPWDLEQTHASLIPYVLEEAHELADAIRHGDDRHLQEELGDLLLQVVLHARIAQESSRFDLAAVARGISAKLIRRHPHVFASGPAASAGDAPDSHTPDSESPDSKTPDSEAPDSSALRASWEAIKAEERRQAERQRQAATGEAPGPPSSSPLSDRLAGKVRGLPALAGAMAISRKAAAAGFEWDDIEGVWQKVHEELEELKEAVASGDRRHAETELGDVLFTLVNVGRWCDLDPEEGLAGTNRRFLQRFGRVEAALAGELGGRSIAELEQLWCQAKAEIRAESEAPPGMRPGDAA